MVLAISWFESALLILEKDSLPLLMELWILVFWGTNGRLNIDLHFAEMPIMIKNHKKKSQEIDWLLWPSLKKERMWDCLSCTSYVCSSWGRLQDYGLWKVGKLGDEEFAILVLATAESSEKTKITLSLPLEITY